MPLQLLRTARWQLTHLSARLLTNQQLRLHCTMVAFKAVDERDWARDIHGEDPKCDSVMASVSCWTTFPFPTARVRQKRALEAHNTSSSGRSQDG